MAAGRPSYFWLKGFGNILKKQINGIHHSVSAKHLQRYCDESAFRYNHHKAFMMRYLPIL
jgi:hypothetical protein